MKPSALTRMVPANSPLSCWPTVSKEFTPSVWAKREKTCRLPPLRMMSRPLVTELMAVPVAEMGFSRRSVPALTMMSPVMVLLPRRRVSPVPNLTKLPEKTRALIVAVWPPCWKTYAVPVPVAPK